MADERKRDKAPPATDEHRPVSGKKDTKRWCRGKVGREHEKKWVKNSRFDHYATTRVKSVGWWTLTCSVCRKEFDYCTDWIGTKNRCKCGQHGANKNRRT
jgi:hypothetical protein